MIETLAQTYSDVFSPEYFVLLCGISIILYEWRDIRDRNRFQLGGRVSVLVFAWAVAFAIYNATPQLFATVPAWGPDFVGSLGLGIGVLMIWGFWRLEEWGSIVPEFSMVLLVLTVFHLIITPFWDISSHVAYAAAPAGHLALVDRRFLPYLVIPIGMVFSRPLVGAHTWVQSLGGLVLAAIILIGLFHGQTERRRIDASEEMEMESEQRKQPRFR